MATKDFKHLETLPIDEDNLIIGSDTERNIRSKSCLNLGFLASNSITRSQQLITSNKNTLQSRELDNFLSVSYILETFLISILNLNSISNPSNTQLTEHYKRRLITISNQKILPSFRYCQNLLYSNFKIWTGLYGTLSYYLSLKEKYNEYYTPSERIYYNSLQLIEYSKSVAYERYIQTGISDYNLLFDLYTDITNSINSEDEDADTLLYNYARSIITSLPILSTVSAELRFYQEWIPKVYTWYINNLTNNLYEYVENPPTNFQRAINILIQVGELLASNAADEYIFRNGYQSLIRQNININLYDLLDELNIIRKQSTYIQFGEGIVTAEEELIIEFYNSISLITTNSNYRQAGNLILSSICPPGGYALLQIMLAANLLNRAYILCYRNRNNNTTIQETLTYKRIIKLIGLSGILLIKTGNPYIKSQGINLLKTFNINLTNIQPNNLIDLT